MEKVQKQIDSNMTKVREETADVQSSLTSIMSKLEKMESRHPQQVSTQEVQVVTNHLEAIAAEDQLKVGDFNLSEVYQTLVGIGAVCNRGSR